MIWQVKKQKTRLYILLTLTLGTVFGGCGYTTRSSVLQYKTIYVTPVLNKIDITKEMDIENKYKLYRPGLETEVTQRTNNKFLFDGNLRPASKANADVVLKSELVEFMRDPLRYSDNNDVQEYRINIRVNISLWNNRTNELIWEEQNFTGYASFFTEFYPVVADRISESTAINNAVDDLARRIVERAVEEW